MQDKLKGIIFCSGFGAVLAFVVFAIIGIWPDRAWKVVAIVSCCQVFALFVLMSLFDKYKHES